MLELVVPVIVVVVTILVLGVGDNVAMLELVVTIPWRARLALGRRLELDEGVIIWGVLAVKVVVVGLRGGLLHLVLGAIIVVLTLGLGAIVGSLDSASVVRSQELVHRIVGGILILSAGDNVAMLELVVPVIVVVVTIPWRARLALGRGLELDEGVIIWGVLAVKVVVVGLRGGLLHLVLGAIIVVF